MQMGQKIVLYGRSVASGTMILSQQHEDFTVKVKRPFCTASTAIFVFSSLKSHFEGKIGFWQEKLALIFS